MFAQSARKTASRFKDRISDSTEAFIIKEAMRHIDRTTNYKPQTNDDLYNRMVWARGVLSSGPCKAVSFLTPYIPQRITKAYDMASTKVKSGISKAKGGLSRVFNKAKTYVKPSAHAFAACAASHTVGVYDSDLAEAALTDMGNKFIKAVQSVPGTKLTARMMDQYGDITMKNAYLGANWFILGANLAIFSTAFAAETVSGNYNPDSLQNILNLQTTAGILAVIGSTWQKQYPSGFNVNGGITVAKSSMFIADGLGKPGAAANFVGNIPSIVIGFTMLGDPKYQRALKPKGTLESNDNQTQEPSSNIPVQPDTSNYGRRFYMGTYLMWGMSSAIAAATLRLAAHFNGVDGVDVQDPTLYQDIALLGYWLGQMTGSTCLFATDDKMQDILRRFGNGEEVPVGYLMPHSSTASTKNTAPAESNVLSPS